MVALIYHIEDLTKVYRGSTKKANNSLTLSIQEGEIFGLLGPNGAGKSTLVNQIAGITRPTPPTPAASAPADRLILSSLRHSQTPVSDRAFLLNTCGRLWCAGVDIDWSQIYRGEQR